jgi:uncharacterized protein
LRPLEIAVIGSGISGLSAAWLLSQSHHVSLIEADARLGGHSHTVDVKLQDGRLLPVDTGFIVSNPDTYQNFMALMDYLDVEMVDAPMSFSVSCQDDGYEYSGHSLTSLLGRKRQWFSPSQWRLAADLIRFYRTAESHAVKVPAGMTLGQFLDRFNYSQTFAKRHILPIAGAIWSSGPDAIAGHPLREFVKFFANHKLFELGERPIWRTVKGGAREYVRRLVEDGKFSIHLSQPVTAIQRYMNHVEVRGTDGFHRQFDHVVIATHGDQALRLLRDPTATEQSLLTAFRTSRNRAVLHRDPSLMPRHRRFWSAWNYHAGTESAENVSVTYWMNALQSLASDENHYVSLNPVREPARHLVDRELVYHHPIFNCDTYQAQQSLWDIQGLNRTWFAGAWFGAGFHEDGLQAGLAVAEQLGGFPRPWTVAEPSGRIAVKPVDVPQTPAFVAAAE